MTIETMNAKIRSTTLGREDHGIFTAFLNLDYGSSGQSFGGYALDEWCGPRSAEGRRVGTAYGMEFIAEILRTLEVESWEKLPGTVCRVRCEHSKIHAIGHFLKDQWFDPSELHAQFYATKPASSSGEQKP